MEKSHQEINQQLILAIDTATPTLYIGIGTKETMLASYSELVERKHLELCIGVIKDTLKQAGIGLKDLAAIVVGLGPGSLIGCRVGVETAKTLAQVLKIPLFGTPTTSPSPQELVACGFKLLEKGQKSSIYDLEPIYLRGPV